MTLSIGNNLIAKPVLPLKGDLAKITSIQPQDSSNKGGETIAESNVPQFLPANASSSPTSIEGAVPYQGLEQNTPEGIVETLDPSEILEWTDDVPPIETEFEEIPLDTNEKVDSIDSDPDGADDQGTSDEESKYDEFESIDGEKEEEELSVVGLSYNSWKSLHKVSSSVTCH